MRLGSNLLLWKSENEPEVENPVPSAWSRGQKISEMEWRLGTNSLLTCMVGIIMAAKPQWRNHGFLLVTLRNYCRNICLWLEVFVFLSKLSAVSLTAFTSSCWKLFDTSVHYHSWSQWAVLLVRQETFYHCLELHLRGDLKVTICTNYLHKVCHLHGVFVAVFHV